MKFSSHSYQINWEEQWALHAPGFQDGYAWIHLNEYGYAGSAPVIRLLPGPGFGDLSHPTTQLMLRLMATRVASRNVVDIGCGSGVLSVCGAAMGATALLGIDIDPSAVAHAQKNARLNHLESCVHFCHAPLTKMPEEPIVVMNMIWSEQKEAWRALPSFSGEGILSGIHISERKAYLKSAKENGWELQEEKELKEWLAFHFSLQKGFA